MHRLTRHIAAALMPALLAGPALAGGFTPPQGCTGFLTVQMKGCMAVNFWRCEADPDQTWTGLFDDAGLASVSVFDDELQWLDAYFNYDKTREVTLLPAADPISVTELMKTGEDRFAFEVESTGGDGAMRLAVTGHDRLTGREVEIDGVGLKEVATRLDITRPDGSSDYSAEGHQYLWPEMRVFLFGVETIAAGGPADTYDNTPVDIILPGEPGFGASEPLYECNTVTSALALPGAGDRG